MWNFWGSEKAIVRFRRVVNTVIEKLRILKESKGKVLVTINLLSTEAESIKQSLPEIKEKLKEVDSTRKVAKATGVAASTAGSTVSAGLLLLTALTGGAAAPLAVAATGAAGVIGFGTKLGTSYYSNRSKEAHLSGLRRWEAAEATVKQELKKITEAIKMLYLANKNDSQIKMEASKAVEVKEYDASVEDPAAVVVLDKVDRAGTATVAIDGAMEHSSYLVGVETAEGLSETFEAAKTGIAEYVSMEALEGAFSGLGVVMSAYEVFNLVKEWNKEDPTLEEVDKFAQNLDGRIKAYQKTRLCLNVIEVLVKPRSKSLKLLQQF